MRNPDAGLLLTTSLTTAAFRGLVSWDVKQGRISIYTYCVVCSAVEEAIFAC